MKNRNISEAGSVRGGLLLLAVTVGLFWSGGQSLYTALTNRSPTVVDYQSYIQTRNSATWLTLTNCMLDMFGCCYKHSTGSQEPTELYVPVRSRDFHKDKIHVLLATRDPQLVATFKDLRGLNSEKEVLSWALKNTGRAYPRRDISGLVRFGIDEKESDRNKLASLQGNLAEGFIILEDGSQPSLATGLSCTGAGVLLVLGAALYFFRRKAPVVEQI